MTEEPQIRVATSLSEDERETTITSTDGDNVVRIWTAQRRYIGALKRSGKFTLLREGAIGSTAWAEFEIAAADWNPASGAKRKVEMSEERRAELSERLSKMRAARAGEGGDDDD